MKRCPPLSNDSTSCGTRLSSKSVVLITTPNANQVPGLSSGDLFPLLTHVQAGTFAHLRSHTRRRVQPSLQMPPVSHAPPVSGEGLGPLQ